MNTLDPTTELHLPGTAMGGLRRVTVGMCILDMPEQPVARRELAPDDGKDKPPKVKWADDILKGLSFRVLKGAQVMMLRNPASGSSTLLEYETDSKGDLVDQSKKPVRFTVGESFCYFWTRDKRLYGEVRALYSKALDGASGSASAPDDAIETFAREHGFDELEIRTDSLQNYTGQNVFQHEICPMGPFRGGDTRPHARMAALLYGVRAGDKQGLLWRRDIMTTDWTTEDGKPSTFEVPTGAKATQYILAHRPALNAMFLAEVVAAMLVNHVKNSAWHYSVFAQVQAIVAATVNADTDAGTIDALMAAAGAGVNAKTTWVERYRRYAHDCAEAHHRDTGKPLPHDLFEKAVDERAYGWNYDPEGAAREILEHYAVEHPIGVVAREGDELLYDRPAHPAIRDDGSYNPGGNAVGGDAPPKYFEFYRFGFTHEHWPREWAKDEEEWAKLQLKASSRLWSDVVKESEEKSKNDIRRVTQKISAILAKYATWPTLVRDLAAHTWYDADVPSEDDDHAKRAELHERAFRCALDFRFKWWDPLPTDAAHAKLFYVLLDPFLKLVFSGPKAEKGKILSVFFEEHAHELTIWIGQENKADAREELERISARMTPLATVLGGAELMAEIEPISVEADLERQVLRFKHGDSMEEIPTRFFEAETVQPGKGILKKAFKVAHVGLGQAAIPDELRSASKAKHKVERIVEKTLYWVKTRATRDSSPVHVFSKDGRSLEALRMAGQGAVKSRKIAKWLKVVASLFEIAEDLAEIGASLKEKGGVKTFVPIAGHIFGAVHETWEAVEFAYKHSEQLLKVLKRAEHAKKGALYIFKSVAEFCEGGANLAEGIVLMWEGSEMLEEAENQAQRSHETVATLYQVKGVVMIAGGAAATGIIVGGLVAGVGMAALVAITGPLILGVGVVSIVIDAALWMKSDHTAMAELEGNLSQALAQEFGRRFGQDEKEAYQISHTHTRIQHLSEDVEKALAIIARAHPADGMPLQFGMVFVEQEEHPAAP